MSQIKSSKYDVVEIEEKEFELTMLRKNIKHQQKMKMLEGKNLGRWEYEQHLKYYIFLAINQTLFKDQRMNRNNKVFKLMAKHIPTRSSEQCRSHHQKIKSKWSTIELILENLAIQFGGMNMKEILKNYDAFSVMTSSSTVERSEESDSKEERIQSQITRESIQPMVNINSQQIYQIKDLDQEIFNFGPSNDFFQNSFFLEDSLFNFM